MTKEEFLDKMEVAKSRIDADESGYYVCCALDEGFDYTKAIGLSKAAELFQAIFRPEKLPIGRSVFFNSDGNDNFISKGEVQKQSRILAICFFEEICLDYKLYEGF